MIGRLLLLSMLAAGFATEVHACSCIIADSPKTAFQEAKAVFLGEVLSYGEDVATVRVIERFKGVDHEQVELVTREDGAACGYGDLLELQSRHLFYAYDHAGGLPFLEVSACSRTTGEDHAECDLRYLRSRAAWWRSPLSRIRLLAWLGWERTPCLFAR
jgi:hypothetical protein